MDKVKRLIIDESHKHVDSNWIVELWGRDKDETKKRIEEAIINGELIATIEERLKNYDDGFKEITNKNRIRKIVNGWLGDNFVRFIVDRDEFKAWLIRSKQWPISKDCLLYQWLDDGLKQTEQSEILKPDLKLIDQRINLITETAKRFNYDLMCVPEGGKKAIEIECLKTATLFTKSTFKTAWRNANNLNLIRMANKEKYL